MRSMSEYNSILINDVIRDFKQKCLLEPEPKTVLFDADNTLYRFSTYGMIAEAKRDMYTKGYFKNLHIFEEAPAVIENLQKLGVRCGIISKAIDSPYCVFEKRQSFSYYFPMIEEKDIYIIHEGEKKTDAISDIPNTILVDDYYMNINEWYYHGGVAIKKSYTGKLRPVPVVTSLIDLFVVLHELNVY